MWYIKFIFLAVSLPAIFATEKEELPIMMVERIEIVKLNEDYLSFNASTRKLNKRDFSLTFYATVRRYEPNRTSMVFQVYAMFSNEYRRTPILIEKSVCAFYGFEFQWFKESIRSVGNIPESCEFPLGSYYIKDYIVDGSKYPDIPWKRIMLETFIKFDGVVNFCARLYILNNQEEYKLLSKLEKQ